VRTTLVQAQVRDITHPPTLDAPPKRNPRLEHTVDTIQVQVRDTSLHLALDTSRLLTLGIILTHIQVQVRDTIPHLTQGVLLRITQRRDHGLDINLARTLDLDQDINHRHDPLVVIQRQNRVLDTTIQVQVQGSIRPLIGDDLLILVQSQDHTLDTVLCEIRLLDLVQNITRALAVVEATTRLQTLHARESPTEIGIIALRFDLIVRQIHTQTLETYIQAVRQIMRLVPALGLGTIPPLTQEQIQGLVLAVYTQLLAAPRARGRHPEITRDPNLAHKRLDLIQHHRRVITMVVLVLRRTRTMKKMSLL